MQIRRLARALYRLYPRTVLAISVAILAGLFAVPLMTCGGGGAEERVARPACGEGRQLVDRVWFDHYPEDPHEVLSVWLLLNDGVGVYQEGSAFRATFDIFEFEKSGHRIDLTFMHDGETGSSSYQVERCDERPPFDLCLTLEGPVRGEPTRYYSFSDEYESELHPALVPTINSAYAVALAQQ